MIFLRSLELVVLGLQILVLIGLVVSFRAWMRNFRALEKRITALEKAVGYEWLKATASMPVPEYSQGDINQEIKGNRHDPA